MTKIMFAALAATLAFATPALAENIDPDFFSVQRAPAASGIVPSSVARTNSESLNSNGDPSFNAVQQAQRFSQDRTFLSTTDSSTNDHPAQQSDFYSVVRSQHF